MHNIFTLLLHVVNICTCYKVFCAVGGTVDSLFLIILSVLGHLKLVGGGGGVNFQFPLGGGVDVF